MEEEIKTLSLLNNPDFIISFFGLILAKNNENILINKEGRTLRLKKL